MKTVSDERLNEMIEGIRLFENYNEIRSAKENSIKGMQEMTAHLEDGVFFFQRIENETSRYLKGHNSRGRMKLEALKLRPGQYEAFHYNIERFLRNRGLKNQCRKNARCVGSCSRR